MSNLKKYSGWIVAVILLVGGSWLFIAKDSNAPTFPEGGGVGTIGTLPIENYVPAILYNDGYYSERAITTTSNFVVGGNATLSGTTTITRSFDGFMLQLDVTVGTTTPVRGAMTNSGSPAICDGESLFVYANAPSTYVPSFRFVLGTTTSATSYSANLSVSSTTAATSTDSVTNVASHNFVLGSNESITLSMGDAVTNASSTYYGDWDVKAGVHCSILE